MRYCVRCGREVPPEDLINGMCVECFVKYSSPFTREPQVELKVCSKCGAVYHKGSWLEAPFGEAVRRALLEGQRKYLMQGASLIDVELRGDLSLEPKTLPAMFHIALNDRHVVSLERGVLLKVEKGLCPRCMALASKHARAVVQVRGARASEVRRLVNELVSEPGMADYLVDVEDADNGFDVLFSDPLPARKLAYELSRRAGAHVKETFKSTRYNPRKGAWDGVITLSVRLPDISVGALVEYRGDHWIVEQLSERGLVLRRARDWKTAIVPYSEYWRGQVAVSQGAMYRGTYVVVGIDKSMAYLVSRETGEYREVLLDNVPFKVEVGDEVKIISVENREYVLKARTARRGG